MKVLSPLKEKMTLLGSSFKSPFSLNNDFFSLINHLYFTILRKERSPDTGKIRKRLSRKLSFQIKPKAKPQPWHIV